MANDRISKVNELIKDQLSIIIHQIFPDDIFSVTQVRTSKDLGYAKIWVSVLNHDEKFIKDLQNKRGYVRRELGKKIILKKLPELNFTLDKTEDKSTRIEVLLDELRDKES